MNNIKSITTLIILIFLSTTAQSQDMNLFRHPAGLNLPELSSNENEQPPLDNEGDAGESENCYLPENIGTVGSSGVCKDKLIVNKALLSNIISSNGNYSDKAIFTGQVTSFSNLFSSKTIKHDISGWETSNVTNMNNMFRLAKIPNKEYLVINDWDVSNVTTMIETFRSNDFISDISSWDVSNVTNMDGILSYAYNFNQDIGKWDVSNVTSMEFSLAYTRTLTYDISGWCVEKISSRPLHFDLESAIKSNQKPLWGTCPSEQ
tara:strand:+ start:7517 stop:8302 length:786 start_codon:yes stop_codon:yes gene_type:complete